jgi:drug/metabolite transporter (DMT)-like permease
MTPAEWLWIPITIWAAFAQTIRNAAQKSLTASLGALGATLVRFLYGLPFALLWLIGAKALGNFAWPAFNPGFGYWVTVGAVSQIVATALLLRVMAERNFALGVAYSKTDAIQTALFGFVLLGDALSRGAAIAVLIGTLGVLLLSPPDRERPLRALLTGWTTRSALLGLASGAAFAMSAVGFRAAALALPDVSFVMSAAVTLVVAQTMQTILLGGWLLARDAGVVVKTFRAWRPSLFAGMMGAAASIGWFTAMAIEPAAHVRALGMIELLFSYIVSLRLFRERLSGLEKSGLMLLSIGLMAVALMR